MGEHAETAYTFFFFFFSLLQNQGTGLRPVASMSLANSTLWSRTTPY